MKIIGNTSGFSLIEIMVAGGLLAIALENAAGALATSSNLYSHQHKSSVAIDVGRSVMESLMMVDDTDPILLPGIHTSYYDASNNPVTSGGFYNAKWTVTANQPFSSIQQIVLVVSWNEAGKPYSISFTNFRN